MLCSSQIRLLREGKEIPAELESKLSKPKQTKEAPKGDNPVGQTDDIKILNEKVDLDKDILIYIESKLCFKGGSIIKVSSMKR